VPSLVGGDRKLYMLLKLGLTPVAAAGFAVASSARADVPAPSLSSCSRLPAP